VGNPFKISSFGPGTKQKTPIPWQEWNKIVHNSQALKLKAFAIEKESQNGAIMKKNAIRWGYPIGHRCQPGRRIK
jgi:hypothetical protein